MRLSVCASTLLLKYDRKVNLCLIVRGVDLQHFLIVLFCFNTVAELLVDIRQIEKSRGVFLFIDGDFKVVNCLLSILFLVVEEHADVEVCFEVLSVRIEGLLVILQAFLVAALTEYGQLFDALSN